MFAQVLSFNYSVLNLGNLPNEIISAILVHLSIHDRFKVRQLNRKWHRMSLTGIDELLVEQFKGFCKDYTISSISRPKYEFYLKERWNRCKLFHLLIKESGKSLKTLVIQFRCQENLSTVEGKKWIQEWARILSILPHYCPNISSLGFKCVLDVHQELALSLFQHYGHQLQVAAIDCFVNISNYKFCDLALQHFNPNRLRCLLLPKINQSYLNWIADQFCLLTEIELGPYSLKNVNEINFDSIRKLTQLEQFICHDLLSDCSSRSLIHFLPVQHMYKLSFKTTNQAQPFWYELFELIELRSLTIDCQTSESFLVGVNELKELEELDLTIDTMESYKQWTEKSLLSVSKLKKLKRLRLICFFLFDAQADFTFSSLQPMLSVVNFCMRLDFTLCHSFDDFTQKSILDVQNLPLIFPNLTHLTLGCDNKSSYGLSKHALLECVDNLAKLQCLMFRCEMEEVDSSIEEELTELCYRKGIVLKINLIQMKYYSESSD